MKKIYITGVAGLLGANIVKELKGKYEVTGADLVEMDIFNITYDVIDLLDFEKVKQSIEKAMPDVLIHTAALVNVDVCEENKELAEKLNSLLTKALAEICFENRIKMIYISTDSVFDGERSGLYSENDVVNPINEYARTKYEGEQHVLEYAENLILRTNIYGLNVQNKNSFGEWIVSSLQSNQNLNMFEDVYFSPILVNDLAQVIDKAIEKDIKGLYHACATGSISKYDFGIQVKEMFGINTGVIHKTTSDTMNFKAPRPHNMGMSNEKLCRELGIQIRTPIESIAEFLRIYKEKEEC